MMMSFIWNLFYDVIKALLLEDKKYKNFAVNIIK